MVNENGKLKSMNDENKKSAAQQRKTTWKKDPPTFSLAVREQFEWGWCQCNFVAKSATCTWNVIDVHVLSKTLSPTSPKSECSKDSSASSFLDEISLIMILRCKVTIRIANWKYVNRTVGPSFSRKKITNKCVHFDVQAKLKELERAVASLEKYVKCYGFNWTFWCNGI